MITLGPMLAHNVAGALVAMYQGIIADYERQLQLLRGQAAMQAAQLDAQLKAQQARAKDAEEQTEVAKRVIEELTRKLADAQGLAE
jgi:predicted Holliday junction resolvase-like endonuclease